MRTRACASGVPSSSASVPDSVAGCATAVGGVSEPTPGEAGAGAGAAGAGARRGGRRCGRGRGRGRDGERGAHGAGREPRHGAPQGGQLSIEDVAGAVGGVAVAVACDARQRHVRAGGEARVDGSGGVHAHGYAAARGQAVQRELPGEQALERGVGGSRDGHALERAEHGDAGRFEVVAAGLGAAHGLVDPAGARLEDAPVQVDGEVVADVVPAADVAVEGVDREQHRGHLAAGVAVGALGVVHERHAHGSVLGRDARRRDAVGPRAPRDDRGLPGAGVEHGRGERRRRGERGGGAGMRARSCAGAHVDEVQAHAAQAAGGAQLQLARAGGPHRVAHGFGGRRGFGRVPVRAGGDPRAEPPAGRAHAQLDVGVRRAVPADADQVGGAPERDAHGELPHVSELELAHERRGRGRERGERAVGPHEPAGGGAGGGREQRASRGGGRVHPTSTTQRAAHRSGVAARPRSAQSCCWRAARYSSERSASGISSSASSSANPVSVAPAPIFSSEARSASNSCP